MSSAISARGRDFVLVFWSCDGDLACFGQLLAAYDMILSVRPLGHPRSKYGKGVMVGAAFFIALHLCNIAAQVRYVQPTPVCQMC